MTTIGWGRRSDDRFKWIPRLDRLDQHEDAAHQRVKSYLDAYSGSIVITEWVLLEFADAFAVKH